MIGAPRGTEPPDSRVAKVLLQYLRNESTFWPKLATATKGFKERLNYEQINRSISLPFLWL